VQTGTWRRVRACPGTPDRLARCSRVVPLCSGHPVRTRGVSRRAACAWQSTPARNAEANGRRRGMWVGSAMTQEHHMPRPRGILRSVDLVVESGTDRMVPRERTLTSCGPCPGPRCPMLPPGDGTYEHRVARVRPTGAWAKRAFFAVARALRADARLPRLSWSGVARVRMPCRLVRCPSPARSWLMDPMRRVPASCS
jgi:hypothetical protein